MHVILMEDLDCFWPKEGNVLFLEVTGQKLVVLNSPDCLKIIWCSCNGCTEKWLQRENIPSRKFFCSCFCSWVHVENKTPLRQLNSPTCVIYLCTTEILEILSGNAGVKLRADTNRAGRKYKVHRAGGGNING